MGGPAGEVDAKPQHALGGRDDPQAGRLRYDRCCRCAAGGGQSINQREHAAVGMLLVDDGRQPDITRRWLTRRSEIEHRREHRRQAPLGVAGSAAGEPAVADRGLEGRHGHALHAHRVHVGLEHHPTCPVTARQHADHVLTARLHRLREDLKPCRAQRVAKKRRHLSLARPAVGRVYAIDGNELRKQRVRKVGGH